MLLPPAALCLPHSEFLDGGGHSDQVFGKTVLGFLHGDHVMAETLKFFSKMKLVDWAQRCPILS